MALSITVPIFQRIRIGEHIWISARPGKGRTIQYWIEAPPSVRITREVPNAR